MVFFCRVVLDTGDGMSTVRQTIQRKLRDGRLTGNSDLRDVMGIGDYLAPRIARSLRRTMPITISSFWTATRNLSTQALERTLKRALQNRRGNQCVPPSATGREGTQEEVYHTGDVNQFGYEACVALLDHDRRRSRVRYGRLPLRLPFRARSSKECGCRSRDECSTDRLCVVARDGACVPYAQNTRGFVGVPSHPNQREYAPSNAERTRVRRRSNTRLTNTLRNDPDSAQDLMAGHGRTLRYSQRGNHLWRRPSPKVRLPARAH